MAYEQPYPKLGYNGFARDDTVPTQRTVHSIPGHPLSHCVHSWRCQMGCVGPPELRGGIPSRVVPAPCSAQELQRSHELERESERLKAQIAERTERIRQLEEQLQCVANDAETRSAKLESDLNSTTLELAKLKVRCPQPWPCPLRSTAFPLHGPRHRLLPCPAPALGPNPGPEPCDN